MKQLIQLDIICQKVTRLEMYTNTKGKKKNCNYGFLDKYLGQKEKGKEKDKDKGIVSILGGDVVVLVVVVALVVVVNASNLTIGSRVKDESQWWSYNE